jgi:hypothetical protein
MSLQRTARECLCCAVLRGYSMSVAGFPRSSPRAVGIPFCPDSLTLEPASGLFSEAPIVVPRADIGAFSTLAAAIHRKVTEKETKLGKISCGRIPPA